MFLAAVPLAVITLIAVIFLPNGAARHPERGPACERRAVEATGRHGVRQASADAEDVLTRELEDAEDAAIDAAAASVALAPVGLAHDPATGSVAALQDASAGGRDSGSRAE